MRSLVKMFIFAFLINFVKSVNLFSCCKPNEEFNFETRQCQRVNHKNLDGYLKTYNKNVSVIEMSQFRFFKDASCPVMEIDSSVLYSDFFVGSNNRVLVI